MSTATDRRVIVQLDGVERHDDTSDTWQALVARNAQLEPHPVIFLRGDTLTRVVRDDQHTKLGALSKDALLELLSSAARFAVTDAQGRMKFVAPPDYLARFLLARTPDQLPNANKITRVLEVPVFGSWDFGNNPPIILGKPGYNAESQTYFNPPTNMEGIPFSSEEFAEVEDDPAVREHAVMEAVSLIMNELLVDFPFTDEASRWHALCMILEPFVREVIGDEPTPMYGVIAHTPGTGKGLLTQVCLGISCGPNLPVMTFTGGKGFEAAENRKALTASLISAPPVIFYDNVTEPLDSGVLAAALTATRWTDRILGSTRMADVPIRNVWVFTANNPIISRELTRRIVPIFLDPGDIDPTTRTKWTHTLPQWANENRAELAAAALTIAQDYFTGEYRATSEGDWQRVHPATADVLASYPRWSRLMGGILTNLGRGEHFLGNLDKLHAEAAVVVSETETFLAGMYEHTTQGQPVSLKEFTALTGPVLAADKVTLLEPVTLPQELLDKRPDQLQAALGYWLRSNKDTVFGNYRVRRIEGRPATWKVEKLR